jgi:hypothetical protein
MVEGTGDLFDTDDLADTVVRDIRTLRETGVSTQQLGHRLAEVVNALYAVVGPCPTVSREAAVFLAYLDRYDALVREGHSFFASASSHSRSERISHFGLHVDWGGAYGS